MITGHYMQNQSLTEAVLLLRARQSGISVFCNHLRSILDHCLEWTNGRYYIPLVHVQMFVLFVCIIASAVFVLIIAPCIAGEHIY